jgi:hypothetical protein
LRVIVDDLLELWWRNICSGGCQSGSRSTRNPDGSREFDFLGRPPGPPAPDQFSRVEAVDRLGKGVVIQIPLLPTEVTTPASASRSMYRMARYWLFKRSSFHLRPPALAIASGSRGPLRSVQRCSPVCARCYRVLLPASDRTGRFRPQKWPIHAQILGGEAGIRTLGPSGLRFSSLGQGVRGGSSMIDSRGNRPIYRSRIRRYSALLLPAVATG